METLEFITFLQRVLISFMKQLFDWIQTTNSVFLVEAQNSVKFLYS